MSNKDDTKYWFQKYNKRCLVLAVVKKYTEEHPNISYENLLRVFPDKLQGARGVVRVKEEINDEKRFFMNNPLLIGGGLEIFVCNQWGSIEEKFNTTRQDIDNFIEHVKEKLKYEIEVAP